MQLSARFADVCYSDPGAVGGQRPSRHVLRRGRHAQNFLVVAFEVKFAEDDLFFAAGFAQQAKILILCAAEGRPPRRFQNFHRRGAVGFGGHQAHAIAVAFTIPIKQCARRIELRLSLVIRTADHLLGQSSTRRLAENVKVAVAV